MRSAAEPSIAAQWTEFGPGGSSRLSSGADARRKRKRSTICATGPICARGRSSPPPTQRVTDQYRRSAQFLDIRRLLSGELYSSVRISVLTSEWRMSLFERGLRRNSASAGWTGARSSSIRPASSRIPTRRSDFPELPYVTLRLAYDGVRIFPGRIGLAIVRAEHQAFYRRVFLHETMVPSRVSIPGLLKPVGLMAANFPAMREQGLRALSVDAFDRFRAADAVRARRRASIVAGGCRPRPRAPRSFRSPAGSAARICSGFAEFGERPGPVPVRSASCWTRRPCESAMPFR